MAPERCSPPPEPSSFSSDVWSYGCIILETTSIREPWIDQFNHDSLLFRALQRKENASIFAHICANQLGPSHLCQLLMQCCVWSKTDRPTFTDILRKLNGDEDADCMSAGSLVATEISFLEKNNNNDAMMAAKRSNLDQKKLQIIFINQTLMEDV
jgi:serine/threonine protein kinase